MTPAGITSLENAIFTGKYKDIGVSFIGSVIGLVRHYEYSRPI